jgi:hypothetical protein
MNPIVGRVSKAEELSLEQIKQALAKTRSAIEGGERAKIKEGKLLWLAKQKVGDGNFTAWLAREYYASQSTAERRIDRYQHWCNTCQGKNPDLMTVDELEVTGLGELNSQPKPVNLTCPSSDVNACSETEIGTSQEQGDPPDMVSESNAEPERAPPGAGDAWEPGCGEPPPPERDELLDQVGNEVPRKLRDVFVGNREAIEAALKATFAARKVAKDFGAWNSWSKFAELEATLTQVVFDFKNATPYAVHEECKGKGCDFCRNVGWLPKWKYEETQRV